MYVLIDIISLRIKKLIFLCETTKIIKKLNLQLNFEKYLNYFFNILNLCKIISSQHISS